MKLRGKLFTAVGILLACYVVVIFVLPTTVVVKDVAEVTAKLHETFAASNQKQLEDQKVLLKDLLRTMHQNINSLLYVVYDAHPWPAEKLWQIMSYNPDIGFLQIDLPDKHVVITPDVAQTYPATLDGSVATLSNGQSYAAFPYVGEYFLLFPSGTKDAPKIEKPPALISGLTAKTQMAQLLIPRIVEGNHPIGIVQFNALGQGEAIFANEVVHTKPMFDAERYFSGHEPPQKAPPIADGSALVSSPSLSHLFLVNTLKTDQFYLSIGMSIDELAKQLAIWSNRIIVVRVGDEFWIGYGSGGTHYSHEQLEPFIEKDLIKQKDGVLQIRGETYYFATLGQLEKGRVEVYELFQLNGETSASEISIRETKRLAWEISLQMFVISLVLVAIMFFIISRIILRNAIRPIMRLAEATTEIAAGRYGEVKLPDTGKKKDEVAILTRSFEEMVVGLQEKEKIRGVLNKVVSKDVADEILKSNIHLGGEDRPASVLFADIRDFTNLTEKLSPQKTIEMLNICMTKVSRVIEGEGGVVDKYVGDEVMAIYGAPITHPDHAIRAVSTGVLILETLKQWNEERRQQNLTPIEMGVGVHSGEVVAGNMGAEDRLNYTVLGANVNLAARLCEVARPGQFLISEQTLKQAHVEESFFVHALEPIRLKGFTDPVQTYEVIGFKWNKEE